MRASVGVMPEVTMREAANWTLEGKVPALGLLNPVGKFVGGKVEGSPGVVTEGGFSPGGDPPEANARNAGGRYRAPKLSACWSSLALKQHSE
jgi:hypothetical protein